MIESLLSKLYKNPKTGFVGAVALYRKAKVIDASITLKIVKKWYSEQSNIQQYSTQNKKYPEFKIASSNPNEWQMDLAFWERQPILIGVNINSRIGYAKLLKNKQAATVQKAIDQFITVHEVSALMSDNGSEFTNKRVESFLDENSITHSNSIPGDHTVLGKIDRFIRTIKARLTKMKDSIGFKKLTQRLLNHAISNYNNTSHSAINAKPNQMRGKIIQSEIDHNRRIIKKVQEGIPTGSIVRHRLVKKHFDKESAIWSKSVYEVIGLDGLKVRIKSKNNHVLYKPVNDLKIVRADLTETPITNNQIWEVEKILDHKKTPSGRYKYLVKWIGFDDTTWEPQDHLRIINKSKRSTLEDEYWSKKW